jgi:putative heme-binding domain-containing protein
MLIRAAREGQLEDRLSSMAAETIFSNPDLSVRALASEVFERPGQEGLPSIGELLELRGDPVRGRVVYRSERALCSTCHTYDGLGVEIGPDLTAIGRKYSRAELLDAILNPSAGIAFGYDSWMMQVRGKGFLTGFVLADGADVVLKDTRGKRHVLAREDIEFRERQRLSVMPEGVALGISPQELADLVAFLAEEREAEPVFGDEVVLFDGGSLDAFDFHLPDGVEMEEVWSVRDGVLVCKGTPFGYLFTRETFRDFELELDWRFDPEKGAGNSGVLLRRVGAHKVWPRSIEAQLMSRNAGDLWNIDEFGMLVDPGRTAGRRTVKRAPCSERPLGEWNHYRIRLDRGDLTVEVNGVVQNTARWCEELSGEVCLQSEGAEIHFRDIRLRPIVGRE